MVRLSRGVELAGHPAWGGMAAVTANFPACHWSTLGYAEKVRSQFLSLPRNFVRKAVPSVTFVLGKRGRWRSSWRVLLRGPACTTQARPETSLAATGRFWPDNPDNLTRLRVNLSTQDSSSAAGGFLGRACTVWGGGAGRTLKYSTSDLARRADNNSGGAVSRLKSEYRLSDTIPTWRNIAK
jgi:hypothetical protein